MRQLTFHFWMISITNERWKLLIFFLLLWYAMTNIYRLCQILNSNWTQMKKNAKVAKSSLKSLHININQDRIFQFDFPPFQVLCTSIFCGNNAGVFCVSKTPAYSSSFLTYLHTLAQVHCLPMKKCFSICYEVRRN